MASNETKVSLSLILSIESSFVRVSHSASRRLISLFLFVSSVLIPIDGEGEPVETPLDFVFTVSDSKFWRWLETILLPDAFFEDTLICRDVFRSLRALCPLICLRSDGFLAGVDTWNLLTVAGCEDCLISKLVLDVVVEVLELMLFCLAWLDCGIDVFELIDMLETSDIILVLLETAARPSRDL